MDGPDSLRQPERRCVEAACLVSEGISSSGLVFGAIRPAGLPGVRHLHFRIGVDTLMR
jgi:hypothetical protein